MTHEAQNSTARGARVNEVLADYLRAADAGQAPSRQELLGRHPDLADELNAFFADHDELGLLVKPAAAEAGQTTPPVAVARDAVTVGPADTAEIAGARVRYFGDYELIHEIARGGMGIVYKARQVSLNRIVAVKMILTGQLASEADVRRFRSEAEAAGNLDHPSIVPIYEVGEQDGQHYFSMKFIEGGSLAADRASAPTDPPSAAKRVATVARAVHHAHQRGILHRDLKPGNILIDAAGQPLVTDFGLAKRVEAGSALTHSGAIVGTPSYMAPEQAAGTKSLTVAVDIYALGAILYELLTGEPPFRAQTPLETLMHVLEREPRRPRQLQPQLDADLETICLQCLAKDPQRRYATAEALAEDLERWLGGEPIQARPAGYGERAVKWARRRPALAGLLAVSTGSAVTLLILAGFLWHNAEVRAEAVQDLDAARRERTAALDEAAEQVKNAAEKRAEVTRLQADADRERKRVTLAREEARHTLYAADMQLAHAAWQADNIPGLLGLLDRHRPAGAAAGGAADLRGFEWHYLSRLAHQERYSVTAYPRKARPVPVAVEFDPFARHEQPAVVAIAPDGKTLATASVTDPIKLWDLETGKLRETLAPPPGPLAALMYSADGDLLFITIKAAGKGPQFPDVKRWQNVWTGMVPPTVQPLLDLFTVHTLPKGGGKAPPARTLDLTQLPVPVSPMNAGLEGLKLLASGTIPLPGKRMIAPMVLAASPDGKLLAVGGLTTSAPTLQRPQVEQVGGILLWDPVAQKEKAMLLGHGGPVAALAFAPDGKTLASVAFDRTVRLWDVATARERASLQGHTAPVVSLAYSHDGKRLASGAADGIIKIWEAATGRLQVTCKGHRQGVVGLAWDKDNTILASASLDGVCKVWDPQAVGSAATITGFRSEVNALAFLPDGTSLAGVDRRGMLVVGDLKGGARAPRQLAVGFRLNTCSAFSPDGTMLAGGGPVDPVELYEVASGKKTGALGRHNGVVYCLAYSPDGRMLAVGTGEVHKTGEIHLWDLATATRRSVLRGYPNHVKALAFSSDGKTLAGAALDGTVKLWETATGTEILTFAAGTAVRALAFAPGDKRLAVAAGPKITLRDIGNGEIMVTMEGYTHEAATLAFSPDSRRLASGGGESQFGRGGGVKLWDTTTGLEVMTLGGPSDVISALAFNADGTRLAAARMTGPGLFAFGQSAGEMQIWDGRPVSEK
jgi:WD40 repeat protein/tRNA A-37 threonylcarbamoyl transferase component Bud32